MNKPNFPKGFRRSTKGVRISDSTINEWIERGIKEIEENDLNDYYVRSGDTLVIVYPLHEDDGGGYEVLVSNDYFTTQIGNKYHDEEWYNE